MKRLFIFLILLPMIFVFSCGSSLQADFSITDIQNGSLFTEVYYKAVNIGTIDIGSFKLWIEVTCEDGSTYCETTFNTDLPTGNYITDSTLINTSGKNYSTAEIIDYELNY